MANLILTIVGIVLVAVAAIAGAYYGGQSFVVAQNKARADTIMNNMAQVASAINLYAADNGGNMPPYTDWTNAPYYPSTDLVPTYMGSWPAPTDYMQVATGHTGLEAVYISKTASQNSWAAVAPAQAYDGVRVCMNNLTTSQVSTGLEICKQLNQICHGSATVITYNFANNTPANFYTTDVFSGAICGCYGLDGNGNGVIDTGGSETYCVEYKLTPIP